MPMGRKLLFLFLLVTLTALSQDNEPKVLFSKAIGENIRSYTHKSQDAFNKGEYERAKFLFDSLINNVINGSYLDNFKVKKLSGRKIELDHFKKPVFLMTYASWCAPGKGEIPALNDIAKQYYKEIDFVILFWDTKKKVRKASKYYNRKITILYIDEKENVHDHIIERMKHSVGFPTSFFINEDKKIIDVRRGVLHPYDEEYEVSFELNHNSFLKGIELLKKYKKEEGVLAEKNK